MDNFIVSARKYRPVTFQSVVGQGHITATLKNAIKNNQLAQAFLFCGPRGVGKTTCARILAKTINCTNLSENIEACGTCDSCRSFQNGNSFSIHELDAASNNSVEDIRSLIEQVRIPPQTGKYKIYIIDEVHMLSQAAFNAFLKTLEEPPPYAIFILATTEKHKILPTILSRCQIFDFNRIKVDDIAGHLQEIAESEAVETESEALHLIAQKADGGLRDALSMFDQLVSFSNKNLSYQSVVENLHVLDYDYFFKVTDAIAGEDPGNALLLFNEVLEKGFDGSHFISGFSEHLRNLLVAKDAQTVALLEVSGNVKQQYLKQSEMVDSGILLSALNIANQCELQYKNSKNQRLQVELALLKMCHIGTAIRLTSTEGTAEPETIKKKTPDIKPVPETKPSPTIKEQEKPSTASGEPPIPPEKPPKAPEPVKEPSGKQEEIPPPETPPQAPEMVVPKWDDLSISASIPSLDSVFDETETESSKEPEYLKGEGQDTFSEAQFLEQWNLFARQTREAGKISLYTLMTQKAPKIKENHLVEVLIENGVQQRLLSETKIDILNHLRKNLNNYAIELLPVLPQQDGTQKPVTNMERYKHMIQKNPVLDQLRKDFNLDFD